MKKYNGFRETLSKIYELDLSGTDQIKIWQKLLLFGPGGVNFDELKTIKRKEIDEKLEEIIAPDTGILPVSAWYELE